MQTASPRPPSDRWGFVLEHLPRPVLVLDEHGTPLELNRAAREPERLELARCFARGSDPQVAAFVRETLERGHAKATLELGAPVALEGFAVQSWLVVVVRDDAPELGLDEELRQLRRLESVSLLAASSAHDLNNLLTPILCLGSLLSTELTPGSRAASLASEIESAAMRAVALVREILTFARPSSRKVQVLNPRQVITALRPLLQRLLGEGIELVLRLEDELGHVSVERARLEHALLNLVANARNALPNGGRVTLTGANVGGQAPGIALAVQDDGPGMSETVRASAFERFFTTRDALGGTGLGLASVRRFAETSSGSVTLESEPGRGTTVTLTLPRVFEPPSD